MDERFKNLPPLFVAGKIVIGEEVEANPGPLVILLDRASNFFRAAHTHFPALDINNRAETTTKGAATPTIDGAKLLVDEAFEIRAVHHRERWGTEVWCVVEEVVDWLQLAQKSIT